LDGKDEMLADAKAALTAGQLAGLWVDAKADQSVVAWDAKLVVLLAVEMACLKAGLWVAEKVGSKDAKMVAKLVVLLAHEKVEKMAAYLVEKSAGQLEQMLDNLST